MWRSPEAWTLLPKFKYLIAYESKEQFKIECNRIKLPAPVGSKLQPWKKLEEVTEQLLKTQLPVVELAPYVKKAMVFHFPMEV